jgi:hypothetical protein
VVVLPALVATFASAVVVVITSIYIDVTGVRLRILLKS